MKTKTYTGYLITYEVNGKMEFTFEESENEAMEIVWKYRDSGIEAHMSNEVTFQMPVK